MHMVAKEKRIAIIQRNKETMNRPFHTMKKYTLKENVLLRAIACAVQLYGAYCCDLDIHCYTILYQLKLLE